MTNHEQIVAAYETYLAENEKFTSKGVKAFSGSCSQSPTRNEQGYQGTPQRNHC